MRIQMSVWCSEQQILGYIQLIQCGMIVMMKMKKKMKAVVVQALMDQMELNIQYIGGIQYQIIK